MSKPIRALLKNSDGWSEVTIENWKDYGKLLNCTTFTVITTEFLDEPISIYCDDEGLFATSITYSNITGYPQPIAGNLVVCGAVDDEGEQLPCPEWLTTLNVDNFID